MEKTSSKMIRTMSEIGIFAAIGYVIDELQSILTKGIFVNGGSIGFAIIAVLIIAFRRGGIAAILTGLIIGSLDLATGSYILHPAQLMLDYVLPYAVVGVVGFLKPFYDKTDEKKSKILWLIAGTIVGGLLKLTSHFLAGIFFWADPNNFAWGLNNMNVYLYCFLYNFAFIGPSIVITASLLVAIFVRVPRILIQNETIISEDIKDISEKKDYFPIISSIIYILGGGFCFIYFLIDYIRSFSDYTDGGAYGYDFNPDSMLIFILGLAILLVGIASLISIYKKKYKEILFTDLIIIIFSISEIYCIARLIRSYVKQKDPTTYWIYFAIGLTTLLLFLTIRIIRRIKKKEKMGD